MRILFLLTGLALTATSSRTLDEVYRCQNGAIYFRSEAPLERIEASSKELKGVVDPIKNTFAWTVRVRSFQGFNSGMQKDHFNENYLETDRFPMATFTGKIIETIDYQQPQVSTIRAKGKLSIHGVEQERIVKIQIQIKGSTIQFSGKFSVPLEDHQISIPKIVNQKIAETVEVSVSGTLVKS